MLHDTLICVAISNIKTYRTSLDIWYCNTSVISVSCSITCDTTWHTYNTLRHIQRDAQVAHAWYLLRRNEREIGFHAGPHIFKQAFPWTNGVPAIQKIYPEIGWIWRSKYFKSDVLRERLQSRHSHLLQKCIRNVMCECIDWCIRNVCNTHLLMHQECLQFTYIDAPGMSAGHIYCRHPWYIIHIYWSSEMSLPYIWMPWLMHQECLQFTSADASGKSAIHIYGTHSRCTIHMYGIRNVCNRCACIHIYCRQASEMSLQYMWMPWLMHQECLKCTSVANIPGTSYTSIDHQECRCNTCECHDSCIKNVCRSHLLQTFLIHHTHRLQKCIRNVCNICECHHWCIRNVCNSHLLMHLESLQFTSTAHIPAASFTSIAAIPDEFWNAPPRNWEIAFETPRTPLLLNF